MSDPNFTEAMPGRVQLADAIGGVHDPHALEEEGDDDGR